MSVAARETQNPAKTAPREDRADLFVGPETMETKVFGRLAAWQNWIFTRPNASGPDGALRRFGTGRKGDFDFERV